MITVLSDLRNGVAKSEVELMNAQEINRRKEEVDLLLAGKSKQLAVLNKFEDQYGELLKRSKIVSSKHKNEYIDRLKLQIENVLALIFPEEHYRVNFERDVSRGEEVISLMVGRDGIPLEEYLPPAAVNGGYAKELIGFSAVIAMAVLKGCDNIWIDEAISSGDGTSLLNAKPLFDELSRLGIQVIAIEHKHEMYNTLSRKEFYLEKDRVRGRVTLADVRVVDESENNSVGVDEPEATT